MKITLTKYDLKTLAKDQYGWYYRISTNRGDIIGSSLPSEKEALKHAEKILMMLNKHRLKKN